MSEGEDGITCESVVDADRRTDGGRTERQRRRERLDVLLTVLSNHRRRETLYYLRERDVAELDELCRYLVEASSETPTTSVTDDRLERTKTAVVHTDLPMLREAGVIDFDSRTETVRYRRPPKRLRTLLRTCSELEDPSTRSE